MRFIHISDLYLGSSPEEAFDWGKGRADELWSTFASVIHACNDQEVNLLLISGNLFCQPPVWDDLMRASELLDQLRSTQVFLIAGPQDYMSENSAWNSFGWSDHVHLLGAGLGEVTLEDMGVTVTGASYEFPEDSTRVLEGAKPDEDAEYRFFLASTGDANHMPCDPETLAAAGFDYLALGGKRKVCIDPGRRFAWPGCLEPLGMQDQGKHGFILGELTSRKVMLKFVPFARREYLELKVHLTSGEDYSRLGDELRRVMRENGDDNIYSIRLDGRYRPGSRIRTEELYRLGCVTRVSDDSIPDYRMLKILEDHRGDLIGRYIEEFMHMSPGKGGKKALYLGLEALLRSASEESAYSNTDGEKESIQVEKVLRADSGKNDY